MKITVLLTILLALVFSVSSVGAAGPISRSYGNVTQNGWCWLDQVGEEWDLTQCDLVVSFTLDMSGYVPLMGTTEWSSLGIATSQMAWLGWMKAGAPYAAQTDDENLDLDDKLVLAADSGNHERHDEQSYDAKGPATLVTPPIGNPYENYGVWFDRDGVDPWQPLMWGMVNGGTYNTRGLYNVVLTYHAINANLGTVFATVNGAQTGFYNTEWHPDEPDNYPVGKSISGDLTKVRVFASLAGQHVKALSITATCRPRIDIKPGSYPNSINLGSKGVVPVAVLSANGFDASTISPATVRFAGAAATQWAMEDVDRDGDRDLILHFRTQELNLTPASTEAVLTGDTASGVHIRGTDSVKIVPKSK